MGLGKTGSVTFAKVDCSSMTCGIPATDEHVVYLDSLTDSSVLFAATPSYISPLFPRHRKSAGFTLVELMIVLIVLAILLAVGVPMFTETVANNRIISEVYAARATLNAARSEATARRRPVTVCRSANGTACGGSFARGYMAFVDNDGDGTLETADGDEVVLARTRDIGADAPVRIAYVPTTGVDPHITFDTRGNPGPNFAGTLTFCDSRGAKFARGLILDPVGTVRAATDTDATPNGIPNLGGTGGTDIVCP